LLKVALNTKIQIQCIDYWADDTIVTNSVPAGKSRAPFL
jgi:hypothetical protein